MAEFLFITDAELKSTTLLGGNVDPDSYKFCLSMAQDETILPMLGKSLYDVIYAGAEADTLTGLYLELYEKFVKPITKYSGLSKYILIASYKLDNGGIFKRTPENTESVDLSEAQMLAEMHMSKAQNSINRFEDWISANIIAEYTVDIQGEVDAQSVAEKGGWYFG